MQEILQNPTPSFLNIVVMDLDAEVRHTLSKVEVFYRKLIKQTQKWVACNMEVSYRF